MGGYSNWEKQALNPDHHYLKLEQSLLSESGLLNPPSFMGLSVDKILVWLLTAESFRRIKQKPVLAGAHRAAGLDCSLEHNSLTKGTD